MTLRVLDMFSGIGGFSIGLHRAGFRTIAFAETDPYASRVLAARFPGVPNVGDVTTAEYPDADFICAGFPCQDISFAGSGAGIAGTRSGLWREVVRAIRVVGPRGTLLENVAALLNRGMGTVLGDLAEVGHDAEWHCISAGAVGAPHIRDRVWIYTQPQHPDTDSPGSHRAAVNLNGNAQPANEQVCLSGPLGAILAYAHNQRELQSKRLLKDQRGRPRDCGEDMADADCEQAERTSVAWDERNPWVAEPPVGRVVDGLSGRVDRLRCLGNAVVPQIPELIGRAILASLNEQKAAA